MKIQIRSYSHAVGEFNYHIQLTPAYRREVFENVKVMKLTIAYVTSKIENLKVEIVEIRAGPEHLHIFVANCKNIAPCKLIQEIKGFSSYMMRKNHFNLFKNLLWETNFGVRVISAEVLEVQQQMQ